MSKETGRTVGNCDPQLLRLSLADALDDRQEEWLTAHLETCASCQRRIEHLAAEESHWHRLRDVLREEKTAESQCEKPSEDQDPFSEFDFAVDFLEPARREGCLGHLGDIEIDRLIGAGGMGIVFRGRQVELDRQVAVKVLTPHLATSGPARQRFAREARAAAVITHPNVMPILTVSSSGKLPYFVMPYTPCYSLQQRLDREGAMPVVDVLRVGLQIAEGLSAAHQQGLVHRDIKPANVLLEKGTDRLRITDFGLARAADDASLTRSGVIAGTPLYMSPEQARGDRIDSASDLFSLGSVLYAMCTGRVPFRAETTFGILRRVADTQPRAIREINADVPAWLEDLIGRLHSKDPIDRFESAQHTSSVLRQCLAHAQNPDLPLPAELIGSRRRPDREVLHPIGGSWRQLLMSVAAILLLTVGLYAAAQNFFQPTPVAAPEETPSTATTSKHDQAESPAALTQWIDQTEPTLEAIRDRVERLDREIGEGSSPVPGEE